MFYLTENEQYQAAYVSPNDLTFTSLIPSNISIPKAAINHLPQENCNLYLMYQWADKENANWHFIGASNMYIEVTHEGNEVYFTPKPGNLLFILQTSYHGSGKALSKHDIVLSIQNVGGEYSGTLLLVPFYMNKVSCEVAYQSLVDYDKVPEGVLADLSSTLKAGAYIKPGELKDVTFSYTPSFDGNVMFVLYEANNTVPLGYTSLIFEKDEPDEYLELIPLFPVRYEMSYQQAKTADDKFILGKLSVDAMEDWIADEANGKNYLKIGVSAGGKDIVTPKIIYQSIPKFGSYDIPLDFLLKDKLVDDYPQTVTIYIDGIKDEKQKGHIFKETIKLGETKKVEGIGEDAGIPDALENIHIGNNVQRYYDISGRPLNGEPTTSGVYIYKDSNSKMKKVFKK